MYTYAYIIISSQKSNCTITVQAKVWAAGQQGWRQQH